MLYIYQGENTELIEEKFPAISAGEIGFYVWRSRDGRLGFDIDNTGTDVVKNLIDGACTILSPYDFISIQSEEEVTKYINNFKGISFYGDVTSVNEVLSEYSDYRKQEKKNKLLQRYGKPCVDLKRPEILGWYIDRKFTLSFKEFCERNGLDYIVWDWSDMGIYFYHPFKTNFIEEYVRRICNNLNIKSKKVSRIEELPYH